MATSESALIGEGPAAAALAAPAGPSLTGSLKLAAKIAQVEARNVGEQAAGLALKLLAG